MIETQMIIRWTTCDIPKGEPVHVDSSWTLWEDRETAVENVRQGIVDGHPRRLLRVELETTLVVEEKMPLTTPV